MIGIDGVKCMEGMRRRAVVRCSAGELLYVAVLES